jgi:hypothetical protein
MKKSSTWFADQERSFNYELVLVYIIIVVSTYSRFDETSNRCYAAASIKLNRLEIETP